MPFVHVAAGVIQVKPRDLEVGEASILRVIQETHGPHNSSEEVFFTDADEATIFIKTIDGSRSVLINLTLLAAWRADGSIVDDEVLRNKWLRLSDS